ncbi:uncharacterized protein LOC133711787 [Rosa rugosa]|uniref:uncharacterized protein LOC133711787 n=1 Tax=Rosa rugosa TaxID=74645 RepID=UPI002B40600D|nr:uncharacterized protein LOC133711787 [Rosa rugosa]
MRKWDIQKLIQNWTSFNSLKKLEKIFENLKEDREESESEEEENRSDEAKTVPEGEEKGTDDQNCENKEDNLQVEVAEQETTSEKNKWEKELQKKEEEIRYITVEKDNLKTKLNEKEQELRKITEDMMNLEERNATLVTDNFCLASSSILLGWKTVWSTSFKTGFKRHDHGRTDSKLLEKESQGLDVPTFMNPLCWNSAENLTVYYVHLYLCEPLFQNLARSNYIFFPISHE